jgi:transposase-like protein
MVIIDDDRGVGQAECDPRRDAKGSATMATASTRLSFGVVCPFCGNPNETVRPDLNNLRVLTCSGCEIDFTPEEAIAKARDQLARWELAARWIEMAKELLD